MTATVDQMIENSIGKEGAYSNHPSDTGGETMWGITARVARKNGYQGAMRDMPRSTAKAIYRTEYYLLPGFDKVAEVSASLAEEMFDTGINMGITWPGIFLQRVLNAFNKQGTLWEDVKVDGAFGGRSMAALRSFVQRRGVAEIPVLLTAVNALQGARYIELAEGRGANEDFAFGWIKNRVSL